MRNSKIKRYEFIIIKITFNFYNDTHLKYFKILSKLISMLPQVLDLFIIWRE